MISKASSDVKRESICRDDRDVAEPYHGLHRRRLERVRLFSGFLDDTEVNIMAWNRGTRSREGDNAATMTRKLDISMGSGNLLKD